MRSAYLTSFSIAAAGALTLGVSACAIPDASFVASIDAGIGPADADESRPRVRVDPASLRFNEGASQTFNVSLNLRPAGAVTVTLTASAGIRVEPSVLIFDPEAEDVTAGKPVTVSAPEDDDTAMGTEKVDLTADGHDPASVAVTVDDLDTLGIEVNQRAVNVVEGESQTVLVRLTAPPPGNSLTISSTVSIADSAHYTVTGSRVFTAANWNMTQEFIVTGREDDNVDHYRDGVFVLKAEGATNVEDVAIEVDVEDNDTQGFVVDTGEGTFKVPEDGEAIFRVSLRQQPSADAVVTIGPPAGLTATPNRVTFTSSTWNNPVEIKLEAGTDNNVRDETVNVVLRCVEPDLSRNVAVVIDDDDTQAIIEDAADPLRIAEPGNGSFTFRLAFEPTDPIPIVAAGTNFSLSGTTSFPFNRDNWETPRTVNIVGGNDEDMANRTGHVDLTAGGLSTRVNVQLDNNDVQELVTTAPIRLVENNISTAVFTVRPRYRPTGPMAVTVTSNNEAVQVESPTINFTRDAFTAQNVMLRAPTDVTDDDETATIRLATAGDAQVAEVMVTTDDPSTAVAYGWTSDFSHEDVFLRRIAFAFPLQPITARTTVTSLQIIARSAGPNARMAIFEGTTTGDPRPTGSPVVSTSAFPLVASPAVSSIAASGVLEANRPYWIVVVFNTEATIASGNPSTGSHLATRCEVGMGFGESWPADFPANACNRNPLFNVAVRGVQ